MLDGVGDVEGRERDSERRRVVARERERERKRRGERENAPRPGGPGGHDVRQQIGGENGKWNCRSQH